MSETRRMTSTAARINRSFTWRLITVLFWVNLLVLALALGGWCYYQEKAALGAAWQPNIWRSVQISSDPMMPIGISRSGFFVSSAAVEIASNPR